ncbi:MAG: S-layer homology domain-containing protein, partial [Clostridia bacterium]|nr:S-layer homology domain-containing protein [Clostridia bacterium]
RYAGYKKLDTSKQAELTKFADAKKVSSYAETAVKWAVAEGIIGGTEKNGKAYLDPQGNATRAQVATMLMRFCDD